MNRPTFSVEVPAETWRPRWNPSTAEVLREGESLADDMAADSISGTTSDPRRIRTMRTLCLLVEHLRRLHESSVPE